MLDKLRELISKGYHCTAKGGGYLLEEVKEPGLPKTRLAAGKQILLCKFDEKTSLLLPFLNYMVKEALAMADYVAFVHQDGVCYVYTIELSKNQIKTYQRKPTEDFVAFVEATARRLYGKLPSFKYRYLLVRKMPAPKGTTRPGKLFDKSGMAPWPAGVDLDLLIYSVP